MSAKTHDIQLVRCLKICSQIDVEQASHASYKECVLLKCVFLLCHKRTCLLVPQKDMSCCVSVTQGDARSFYTRRHVFSRQNNYVFLTQDGMSSCNATRNVSLCQKKTCLLVIHEYMSCCCGEIRHMFLCHESTCVLAAQTCMCSRGKCTHVLSRWQKNTCVLVPQEH